MAFKATWVNKTKTPDGINITLVLDGGNNYPATRIDKSYTNKRLADLTNAFLNAEAKRELALYIQQKISEAAEDKLGASYEQWRIAILQPAIDSLVTHMQNDWQKNGVRPSDIQTRILNQWAIHNVDGILGDPVVTVNVTDVNVSNN